MMSEQAGLAATSTLDFLPNEGEMGRIMRHHDWSKSIIGWPHQWPQSLRTIVSLILNSTQPMAVMWGEHGACLYNDAFRNSLPPKQHPGSLGQPVKEVWKELWHMIGSSFEQAIIGKGKIEPVSRTHIVTCVGGQEEVNWTYSFSPVDDQAAPHGIGGVVVTCTENSDLAYSVKALRAKCDRLTQMFNKASAFMALTSGPNHRVEFFNPSYDQVVGHRPVIGRFVAEALPETVEQGFVRIMDRVFATGKAYTAERASYKVQLTPDAPVTERITNFMYQPVLGPDGKVNAIFVEGTDITEEVRVQEELERVNSELAFTLRRLKAIEQRKSFRLKLTDRLRSLDDPDELAVAAAELLGRFLGVTRVFYGDFTNSGDGVIVRSGWTRDGAESMIGQTLLLDDFGPEVASHIRAGEPFALGDVNTDERSVAYADAYLERDIKAVLALPITKSGSWRVLLGLHDSKVHHWSQEEITLAQDVVDRTWSAIESARAHAELRRERDYSKYILDSMTEGFASISADWTMTHYNAEASRISQIPISDVVGRNHWEVWPELKGTAVEDLYVRVRQTRKSSTTEVSHAPPDGEQVWLEIRAYPALDGGLAVFFRDITERKMIDEEIRHASLHDPLTGLPNRAMLFEYASHMLPHNQRASKGAAVLFLDLDDFKPINDTHGHDVGDKVLKEVSRRLSRTLRAEDLVIRMGGDEFVVLLQDIDTSASAADVARNITKTISEPYEIGELSLSVSTSIGISMFPENGDDIDTLVSHADAAMYEAKQEGRNNFQFYSSALTADTQQQNSIEQTLKLALNTNSLQLFYQPIVDINTCKLMSVEALLRIKNSELGPEQFVPVAEASGLINPIGRWVLKEAARQSAAWTANGLPAIPIAVNVSAVEFRHREFVDRFEQLIHEHSLEPALLELELTETAVIHNREHAIASLSRLRALGITVSLDDFGTGQSSLASLNGLPLDKIKIDKSLISKLKTNPDSRAITDAMLTLGLSRELQVIAEGTETSAALDYVQSRGFTQAQGFFFCEPLLGEAFESWYLARVNSEKRLNNEQQI
ncbi:EAL domain-containing protein [Marinobacter aromaticivorans]|uniref:EAL domain-containing protein n=1 Tax=Marinobacter aromaticivorans TaxID=1494078 RepID=A0ABW2IZC6_9GAMM|nr:EAL domain-containing protein [Marinobacter aromaticivorans]